MSVTDIVYFCSVLQLSKQQKPQNSEADTWIIAKATRSICKQSNAETPKPPTYPFINLQSQRAWTQIKQHADLASVTTNRKKIFKHIRNHQISDTLFITDNIHST